MLPNNAYLTPTETGALRISGTRVGLEHLIQTYREGFTADELAIQYPTVTLEQVHGVLAYYLSHRTAVDEYIQQGIDRFEDAVRQQARRPPSEAVLRIREKSWRLVNKDEQCQIPY